MSWLCAQGADCVSPHNDGRGGHTISDPIDRMLAEYFGTEHRSGEDNVGDPPPHGLCGWCWFKLNGPFPIRMAPE